VRILPSTAPARQCARDAGGKGPTERQKGGAGPRPELCPHLPRRPQGGDWTRRRGRPRVARQDFDRALSVGGEQVAQVVAELGDLPGVVAQLRPHGLEVVAPLEPGDALAELGDLGRQRAQAAPELLGFLSGHYPPPLPALTWAR